MNRRQLLATLGVALGAGCGSRPDGPPATAVRSRSTPTETATVDAATKPFPSPPANPSAETARAFVEAYEERLVYNELVERGYARSVEVESAMVRAFRETDAGYYLLSACRGSGDSASGSGSMTRNASGVVHFVGSGVHDRVPYNWYSCAESGGATTDDGSERDGSERDGSERDVDPAKFQLYDLQSEIDYDRPESGGRRVDVRVERESGETVLDRTYQTSLPLTVQPRVVARPGRYRFAAALDDGTRVERDWDLLTPSTPSWWGLAAFITPDGDLFADVVDPPGDLGLPNSSLCRR